MPKNFTWKRGEPLPSIERHTVRKLEALRTYLNVYFDTVIRNPAQDTLNITLVDGFCGGGAYDKDGLAVSGSPLVILNAVRDAEVRLNAARDKPIKINARYVFVDNNIDHVESLRFQIIEQGFGKLIDESIKLIKGDFSEKLPAIISSIRDNQRRGRSIFVLDQFGYSDVPMASIKTIFSSLDRPEVILTFAIDALLNFLREESAGLTLIRQFGIDERFISEWQSNKDDDRLGRLITQRSLMSLLHDCSGAEFFTPFMLWSRTDNRWMMLAHLSRHQAARDKMLEVYWGLQNNFAHFGKGSLFSLGFDPRLLEDENSLFEFSEHDRMALSRELQEELPREIRSLMRDGRLAVTGILEAIGNRTAATNNDIFEALLALGREGELEVLSSTGAQKRPDTRIVISDTLVLPTQRRFRWT